jgi:thiol-disulfide isomerase/thioredoxin
MVLATPFIARAAGAVAAVAAPANGLAPLGLATGWLNGRRTAAELRGKVVLLDIFTFECINCIHVTPNLKRLYDTYRRPDLEIVAVHTPEVPSYQSRLAYLAEQSREAALPWPIAIDNRSAIWNAYGISAWPTQLLFDRHGRLRHTIVGEGQDNEVNAAVRSLVTER